MDITTPPPKKRKQKPKYTLSFTLTPEITRKLDILAHRKGYSTAGYLSAIITEAVRRVNDY